MAGIASAWSFRNLFLDFRTYIRDEASDSVKYYGVSNKDFCGESEPLWMIWREVRLTTGIYRRDYANGDQLHNKKWADRSTYFGAIPGSQFQNTYSLAFDGVNDYLAGFIPTLDRDSNVPFSMSMWVKPNAVDANTRALFSVFSGPAGKVILMQNGRVQLYLLSSGSAGLAIQSGIVFAPGLWTHITVTYDGTGLIGGLKVYAAGTLSASTTLLNNLGGTIVSGSIGQVGAQTTSGTRYFPGRLDEIGVWNKALSQAEVTAIYNGGVTHDLNLLSFKSRLINWYRMGDNDIFPTIYDSAFTGPNVNLLATNMSAASIVADVP